MKKIATAALIAAAMAGQSAAAQSVSISEDGSYRIDIRADDLNLADAAGLKELDQRIHRAANRVCGVATSPSVFVVRQKEECRASVMEAARPQLALAAAAKAKTGTALAAAY